MKIRTFLIFSILLLIFTQSVAAKDDNSSWTVEILRRAFAYGFDDAMKYQGEQLYTISGTNATSAKILPDILTESNIRILRSPWVNKYKDMTAFWYVFFFTIFVIGGGATVLLAYTKPEIGKKLQRIRFVDESILDIEKFISYIILGVIIWLFADRGIEVIFQLEWVLSNLFSSQAIYNPPPPPMYGIEYMLNGASIFFLTGFGIYRFFVIGIVLGFRYILFVLVLFPKIGSVSLSVLEYSAVLLFSRVILVAIAVTGLLIVQGLPVGSSLISFIVLDGILIIGSVVILVGPALFKWLFSQSYKMVIA